MAAAMSATRVDDRAQHVAYLQRRLQVGLPCTAHPVTQRGQLGSAGMRDDTAAGTTGLRRIEMDVKHPPRPRNQPCPPRYLKTGVSLSTTRPRGFVKPPGQWEAYGSSKSW